MHTPGNSEPQPVSQRQQVHRDELTAIPIKKRRFLMVSPPSPEEKIPDSGDCESENKQDPQIPDEKESNNNQESPIDPNNASKTSVFAANREVNPSGIKSEGATVEIFVSEPQGVKPAVSLNPVADNISPKEKKTLGSEVPESSTGTQTSIVKQEIELSSEQKGPLVLLELERKKPVAICPEPEKLDPSVLSLALGEGKPVGLMISNCTTLADVGSIRSNWDLNTTMEDWEGASSKRDSLVAHTFADIGGFVKTSSCLDEKSSLTTAENVGLGLSKGKQHIPDVQDPNSSIANMLLDLQCKIDDSLRLRLEMPHRESLSLSGKFISSVNPNMNRAVKLEPVDESSRRNFNVGSSSGSNSNMLSLKLGSVKTESLNNHSLETVLKSHVNPDKLVNQSGSMKPGVHKERCEPSSFSLSVPLVPQNYIEHSNHNKDLQLGPCNTDYKHKLACVDEAAAEGGEKTNVLSELNGEELLESGNCAVGSSVGIRESIRGKGDEDLEEGEVREPLQLPVIEEGPSDVWNDMKNLEYVGRDSKNLQGSGKEDSAKENRVKSDLNKESVGISLKPNNEDGNNNHLHNVSDTVLEVRADEKTFVSVTPNKQLNLSGRKNTVKEISSDRKNVDSRIGSFDVEDAVTTTANKTVQEICPVKNVSTLSNMVETSLSGQDAAKDSGNKRRIINLSHASAVKSPGKTRPVPNRFMVPRSGKERYSDLDGDVQPCGNRERKFSAGSKKFIKDRVNDRSLRNSRPNFMHGRGRKSGRFSSLHSNKWDSNHEFAPETSYGTSNYRRKRALDTEVECDGYDIPQDGNNNNRRKTTKNEFPQAYLSPGENSNRNGSANRGDKNKNNQTFRKFPRNMSPNDDIFTRNLSDDLMSDHVYNHPEAMYDEPDGQLDWDNWNFSRKGYPRIRSKSPVSPYRRFPNGLQDLPQHRSPGFYQTRRMRSPIQRCFRDEIFPRRRGSPYGARHLNNDLWDIDPRREHVHPRPSRNTNRRGSGRRMEVLDSREMEDGDEYMNNGPFQSNKFQDERRNFDERRGPNPTRLFQPGYDCGDGENFRFHMNDGPGPYRFCPETDGEFVEIGDDIRERKFDGRIKHQPMGQPRRNRNVEELQDGNYMRSVERVWHDDDNGKKRRF